MVQNEFIEYYRKAIDKAACAYIETLNVAPKLKDSIMYSFCAGGKRIRPLLLLATLSAFEIDPIIGINTAIALELVHTSSLIHDDLPSMDNDDYRRGKLTNHKVFGEATAILAGDALLVNCFNLICQDDHISESKKIKLIDELAKSSGANGMIGGQEYDIENENRSLSVEELMHIDAHKTGKLIQFPLLAGGIIADCDDKTLASLRNCAYHIGIAFQIKDDILDVVGDTVTIGKQIHSDEKNNKCTYVSLLGLNEAQLQLQYHYEEALKYLRSIACDRTLLEGIFKLIIDRNK